MSKVKISKFWSPNPKEKLAPKNGRSLVLMYMEKIDSGVLKIIKTRTLFAVLTVISQGVLLEKPRKTLDQADR